MNPSRRWEPAVNHRGTTAERFFEDYFGKADRRVLLIGGAGFDPRSTTLAERFAGVAAGRVRGLFIREERPQRDDALHRQAEIHIERLRQFVEYSEASIEIISHDDAIIGGIQAAPCVRKNGNFGGVTDVVLDFSALSKGVSFPIARGLLDGTILGAPPEELGMNVHAVVLEESWTDSRIVGEAADRAEVIKGFRGELGTDDMQDAARLWLPQLTKEEGTREVLRRIYQMVNPHAVCPILPFPAFDPRLPDELLEYHSEAIQNEWKVDAPDLIYAHENSPLDIYRTILRIDDARRRVFTKVGGSLLILSPLGSKALAIGSLMAAYERNFPVVYVESTGYRVDSADLDSCRRQQRGEIIHIWLAGDVYPSRRGAYP
ncbi:MAG: hypothetical protein L0Z62_49670 [Gemmataceae bacterium]|nr:hypothetical protein [Gemmataceae bacterium]